MAPKPPKKINKPTTPDSDPSIRPPTSEEGVSIPRDSSDSIAGLLPDDLSASLNASGNRRNEGEAGSASRQPEVEVQDIQASGPTAGQSTETTADITFLPGPLAASLTRPQADGLRYGKHQRIYAEIENEGVTLVRRDANGEYRAASPNKLDATGPLLERVAGTDFWRRKSAEEQPGPSKRPRLDEDTSDTSDTESFAAGLLTQDSPMDLSSALWRNWGTATKPQSGESIAIDGLHYRIVPGGAPDSTHVAYLEHPHFSPSRYADFEQMLHDNPTLQPRWAVRQDNTWRVVESSRPFDKNLTGYVSVTFRDFSDTSLSTVARAVFNRANNAEVINAFGLMVLHQTFRNWISPSRARAPRRELADPLLMLPVASRLPSSNGWITLPPPDAAGALRRLDFAPEHFPVEWTNYTSDPSDYNLKRMVGSVLVRNGYDVFPLTQDHRAPLLVFTRRNHDAVFFLRLERVNGESVREITSPGDELSNPQLPSLIGEPARAALLSAYDQNRLVWLLGGPQENPSGLKSVFLIREG
ncbi:hypothetical protein PS918_04681 [Pseudomonas fluorescens]|uniref:Uncharacterized protein n=1 Tax=Pseudomonas fluorescens TaxID=294 RepID=A0A5E7U591_PSEFL|nr:hypothetical protein [Pseudomonas fluorescens]VVQ06081.1 hypothetical protein PS918_04681 [Pseudomonas fluorescens]